VHEEVVASATAVEQVCEVLRAYVGVFQLGGGARNVVPVLALKRSANTLYSQGRSLKYGGTGSL
jgi:hypothetical protein